jgi:hypothetical protein
MTATYAYFIASAGSAEAIWLTSEVGARERSRLASEVQKLVTDALTDAQCSGEPLKVVVKALRKLRRLVNYRLDRGEEAIKSVRRLALNSLIQASFEKSLLSNLKEVATYEQQTAENAIQEYAKMKQLELSTFGEDELERIEMETQKIVPKRVFRGPVSIRPWIRRLSSIERDEWHTFGKKYENVGRVQATLAMYWADGRRNLLEISRLVELEAGSVNLEYLKAYFNWLEKMGLLKC